MNTQEVPMNADDEMSLDVDALRKTDENSLKQLHQSRPVIGNIVLLSFVKYAPHEIKRSEQDYVYNVGEFFKFMFHQNLSAWTSKNTLLMAINSAFSEEDWHHGLLHQQKLKDMAEHLMYVFVTINELSTRFQDKKKSQS